METSASADGRSALRERGYDGLARRMTLQACNAVGGAKSVMSSGPRVVGYKGHGFPNHSSAFCELPEVAKDSSQLILSGVRRQPADE
mmetsp:Transcript_38871/g.61433  ORF Transcript_38871/g.61433 Transcript_38871/m.61433 type:complete len:87 (-) Transcript_38871:128-388(-)